MFLVTFLMYKTVFGRCASLEIDEMLSIADHNILVTTLSDIEKPNDPQIIQQIILSTPVIFLRNSKDGVFINLHEFVFIPGALEFLLAPPSDTPNEDVDDKEECEAPASTKQSQTYMGQPTLISKFPDIMDIATTFIKQHGFSAHHRRRTETCNSSGMSIKEVRTHLIETIPGLKEHGMSESTVRRLFKAPNLNRSASSRYHKLIDCKLGIKDNLYRELHPDAHYLFARNKQRRELAAYFDDECNLISVDDMAKVKVGAPAVSRYHQIRKLYSTGDTPNLKDHDYPINRYLLNVLGYIFCEATDSKNDDYMKRFDHTSADMSADSAAPVISEMNLLVDKDAENRPLLETFVVQLRLHMNTDTTTDQLKDVLVSELDDNAEYYATMFPLVDKTLIIEKLNSLEILTEIEIKHCCSVLASIFRFKVVLWKVGCNATVEVEGRKVQSNTSSIYIRYSEDGGTHTLVFTKEDVSKYKTLPGIEKRVLIHDNLGKLHLIMPQSGPSSVFVRSQRFNSTTISTQVTDLFNTLLEVELRGKRPILFIMSDNGPDFNPVSLLNSIYLYRMFKHLHLDFLCVFTYAVRYSAYNCKEHMWAKLSNMLSGVILLSKVPGESKPPSMQSGLTESDIREKEKVVFDAAMEAVAHSYWKDATLDSYDITVDVIKCGEDKSNLSRLRCHKSFLEGTNKRLA